MMYFSRYAVRVIFLIVLTGCGDTMDYFDEQLAKYGYIRFRTPLRHSNTGTLLGGTPQNLAVVTNPQTCFPDEIQDPQTGETIPTNLRYRDDSTLPRKSEAVYFRQESFVRLAEVMGAGSPSIKLKLTTEHVHGVELEMKGVHIEYMDSVYLSEFYKSGHMKEFCKDYLDSVGFVIQAIQVEEMEFTFFDQDSGRFELDVENIEQFIDISTDIEWRIERNTSLVITTPKYIGYQLGVLRRKDDAMALYRATKEKKGQFHFEKIYVFDELDDDEGRDEQGISVNLPSPGPHPFHIDLGEIERQGLRIDP